MDKETATAIKTVARAEGYYMLTGRDLNQERFEEDGYYMPLGQFLLTLGLELVEHAK